MMLIIFNGFFQIIKYTFIYIYNCLCYSCKMCFLIFKDKQLFRNYDTARKLGNTIVFFLFGLPSEYYYVVNTYYVEMSHNFVKKYSL